MFLSPSSRPTKLPPSTSPRPSYTFAMVALSTPLSSQTHKATLTKSYVFNRCAALDVLEIADSVGWRYSYLNIVGQGTPFQIATLVRTGGGTPSSSTCFQVFLQHWVFWVGYPREIVVYHRLHTIGDVHQAPRSPCCSSAAGRS